MASKAAAGSLLTSSAMSNEVKHLAERLNAAQVKIKRLNRLEAALVDFFMEVMDRSIASSSASSGFPMAPEDCGQQQQHSQQVQDSAFARQKRKEQFLRKADGDPISLLNALRTHLRLQFTVQSEQQANLSSSLSTVASRKEIQEKGAKDEIRRLEAACEAHRQRVEVLTTQLAASEHDRRRLDGHYKSCLEQMSSELHRLRAQDQSAQQRLQQQQQEAEALKQSCETLLREKKRLADDLHSVASVTANGAVTIPSGGAALPNGSTSQQHCSDLASGTPAENQNLRRALRDYELKLSKLEAANDEAKLEAQRLQQQLVGMRHSTQAQAVGKLEKEFKKTRAQADENKKRLGESDAELLRTKAALKERDAKIQQMKDEYNKLFHALQKIKTQGSSGSLTSASSLSVLHNSPGKLSRLTSSLALGHSSNKLKAVASTPSLLTINRRVSAAAAAAESTNATGAAGAGTATAATTNDAMVLRQQANDNPYLLEHYKARLELLEKEIEGFKVQIRKMIASEYRYKQKNRLFRVEKSQLVDTCDRLRLELDRAVLSSAKVITNSQKQQLLATNSYSYSSRSLTGDSSSSAQSAAARALTRRDTDAAGGGGGATTHVSEVKKLRQRNQFLEERFRAIVASAGAAADAKKKSSDSKVAAFEGATLLRPHSAAPALARKEEEDFGDGSGDEDDSDSDASSSDDGEANGSSVSARHSSSQQLRRQSSIMAIRASSNTSETPSSATVPPTVRTLAADASPSYRSLDADTLQALAQVKTKARVRPQSAQSCSQLAPNANSRS